MIKRNGARQSLGIRWLFYGFLPRLLGCCEREYYECFHGVSCVHNFEKSQNATFIALIPKKVGIVEMKDFCLITLVNGVYKITSRVVANRMSSMMENIILKS